MEKYNLNVTKYIIEKEKIIETKKLNDRETEYITYKIVIKYLEFREQIVSFIEHKIGKNDKLDKIKTLFNSDNRYEDYNSFLDAKAKYLSKLNLDNMFGETEQMKKRKEEILKQYEENRK